MRADVMFMSPAINILSAISQLQQNDTVQFHLPEMKVTKAKRIYMLTLLISLFYANKTRKQHRRNLTGSILISCMVKQQ